MSDDAIAAGSENQAIDKAVLRGGLRAVRRRRWYLWMIILVYMPLMGVAMTYKAVGPVFIGWFVVMFVIALYAALARCPRCGNYFHMHGMTLLYLRKCLHCQLHLTADKRL
jgi:uncharacterized membrane protein